MSLFTLLHTWLIPKASALVLDAAGTWTTTGQPNPAIVSMWQRICTTLPGCTYFGGSRLGMAGAETGGIGTNAPIVFAMKAARYIFFGIGGIAVIVIVYAGINLLLTQGNDETYAESKKMIIYAVVGLALALISGSVMIWVQSVVLPQLLQ